MNEKRRRLAAFFDRLARWRQRVTPSPKDVDFFALVCVAFLNSVDFFASNLGVLFVVPVRIPRMPKARNAVFSAYLIGT